MTNYPKISIVCVTKNAADHLPKCLDSIISQEYRNIEIVIFDALSTDGTQEILKSYADKIAFWKSEADSGIYDAMNKALKIITGQWVYFMGADDDLLPDFSNFVKCELQNDNIIYYANVIYKGNKTKGEVTPYKQAKHGIFHQTMVYPAKVFLKYKYNTAYKMSADYALNLQLHGDSAFKIEYRDYTIANYNDTGLSSYYTDNDFQKAHYKLVMDNFGWTVKFRFWLKEMKAKRKARKFSNKGQNI